MLGLIAVHYFGYYAALGVFAAALPAGILLQNVLRKSYEVIIRDYDELGRMLSMTDPRGEKTTMAYNALNLVDTLTRPDGSEIKYQYDAYGKRSYRLRPYQQPDRLQTHYEQHRH